MFSKACEYGLRATFFIAQESRNGKRVSLKSISEAIDSPMAFTAKVLQELARQGVVDSVRGPKGGFEILPSKQPQVMLSAIVAAIDGDKIYKGCGLGLKECSNEKPCPVHDKFLEIRGGLQSMLENTSVHELMEGLGSGLTFLK
ncbi:MAG: Rrf2 family transcriptional regulator [Bacteroidetes bacterium]|nr:MAG: Rrf2 family transcriptional regulator [Bacteroidota bacterium]